MALIAVSDGTSTHTGTTAVGPVAGTLVTAQSFCTIEGLPMMTEDGTMNIPSHLYQLVPPLSHSHIFNPTASQVFVTIEGIPICVEGDSYDADATQIDSPGSNSFVEIL